MEDSGIDSDPKQTVRLEDERFFARSDSSCSGSDTVQTVTQRSTTKQLQKKLEEKIKQAKRIQRNSKYTKVPDEEPENSSSSQPPASNSLIPIHRLLIPQKKRKQNDTLVDFWHSDNESEDEITLFPDENKSKHKQDLTDTFSIEELSDNGSEDSLHLGIPPDNHPDTKTYAPIGCFNCQCQIL